MPELGLVDWEVTVVEKPIQDCAETAVVESAKKATITLSTSKVHGDIADIIDTAIHEAVEIKLWMLLDYEKRKDIPADVKDAERHAVIHAVTRSLKNAYGAQPIRIPRRKLKRKQTRTTETQ
jgi:hypothetical protein